MSYGELYIAPVWTGVNKQNGRFLKGHVPANKGKKWSDYLGKRKQKRCAKGWKNLDLHRNKNGRADTAGRCRKQVIAVMDDGRWQHFSYLGSAAEWIGGSRENVGRCCRLNQSKAILRNLTAILRARSIPTIATKVFGSILKAIIFGLPKSNKNKKETCLKK